MNNEFYKLIGTQIEHLLLDRGRSVKDLAAFLGMSTANLYAILRGDQGIRVESLAKVAEFLDTTTDKLIGRGSAEIPKELEEQIDRIIDNKLRERGGSTAK